MLLVLRILRGNLSKLRELASSMDPVDLCDEGWPSHVINSVREERKECGNMATYLAYLTY